MTTEQQPMLIRSAPYFPVADIDSAVAYYRTVLGFALDYAAGTPAEFAIVSRDGLSIMLRRVTDSSVISPNERQGGTWDVFFWVRGIRQLHDDLLARSADVVYGPTIQAAYEMEEFAVRDSSGYVLGFGEPLAHHPID